MPTLTQIYDEAILVHRAGDFARAEQLYRQVLAVDPAFGRAWHLLGVLLHQQGDHAAGIQYITRAIGLEPTHSVFYGNLGAVYRAVGRTREAEETLRRALAMSPHFAAAHCNLALVLSDQNRCDEAVPHFHEALRLAPQDVSALRGLGFAYSEIGLVDEAVAAYQQASTLSADPIFRVLAATQLPLVYSSMEDLLHWRNRLANEVAKLVAEGVVVDLDKQPATPVFSLAHQGMNDLEIQRNLARLYRPGSAPQLTPRRPDGRRKHVGFISSYFCHHTIGKLMRGVLERISRDEFYVTVFSIGHHEDDIARSIAAHADQTITLPRDLPAARRMIAEAGPEILMYADIGMDQTTYSLAFSRLAPVQCVTWGHPETTGLETTDYFVSSDAMEAPGAEAHYSEKLVRLPSLNFYFHEAPAPSTVQPRAAFGLDEQAHLYICPQSIYKFHPEFDAILAEILRRDPQGRIVLIQWIYKHSDDLLRERFRRTMPDVADRVQFIRRLQPPEFMNLLMLADVALDPIHYGGGNSTCEALSFGLPTVTLPSEFLRGRITQALLGRIGLEECIAASPAEYIEIAVRLGTDADYRRQTREKIVASKHLLFEDATAVRDLETLFRTVNQRRKPGGCNSPGF